MRGKAEGFRFVEYVLFGAVMLAAMLLCICAGSVPVSVGDAVTAIWNTLFKLPIPDATVQSIIVFVRIPRILCVALVGAALSLCGGAMQGLLKNPLADGSTLGVSSGASLGAVISIALSIQLKSLPLAATALFAMLFAFFSLIVILSLAYKLDCSLSTNTIILVGIIFSMFANSIISLLITFAGERIKSIMFWTMGSLSGSSYLNALVLLIALAVFGSIILRCARELNAFAIGEDNARSVGVDVRRVRMLILIAASGLIGVCVSIGGSIGFVGLVIPHMTRMLTGPNHKRLLPGTLFLGSTFLLLSDLTGRVILSPLELPIGVVTSFIGAIAFIYLFYLARRKAK